MSVYKILDHLQNALQTIFWLTYKHVSPLPEWTSTVRLHVIPNDQITKKQETEGEQEP